MRVPSSMLVAPPVGSRDSLTPACQAALCAQHSSPGCGPPRSLPTRGAVAAAGTASRNDATTAQASLSLIQQAATRVHSPNLGWLGAGSPPSQFEPGVEQGGSSCAHL